MDDDNARFVCDLYAKTPVLALPGVGVAVLELVAGVGVVEVEAILLVEVVG